MQNQPGDPSYAGAVIGGIAGGILGHTVGHGTGKDVATAVSAATGAIDGNNIDNPGGSNPSQQTRLERHSKTVDNWTQQIQAIPSSIVTKVENSARFYRMTLVGNCRKPFQSSRPQYSRSIVIRLRFSLNRGGNQAALSDQVVSFPANF